MPALEFSDDVRRILGVTGGDDVWGGNILSVIMDYAHGQLYFGNEPNGRLGTSLGPLFAIDVGAAFAAPKGGKR